MVNTATIESQKGHSPARWRASARETTRLGLGGTGALGSSCVRIRLTVGPVFNAQRPHPGTWPVNQLPWSAQVARPVRPATAALIPDLRSTTALILRMRSWIIRTREAAAMVDSAATNRRPAIL
jgi:hypothetical protein